jgi:hypothetical protein
MNQKVAPGGQKADDHQLEHLEKAGEVLRCLGEVVGFE